MRRWPPILLLGLALVANACTSDGGVQVEVARVGGGEVVRTVAAGAELQAADRVTVSAPASGRVVELLVEDGDRVRAGDPLLRLASDSIEEQVAQAQAAVDAADELAGAAAAGGGFDLAPLVGSFGGQLDAFLPPLLGALSDQADALDAAADAAERRREQLNADLEEARGDLEDRLADLAPELEPGDGSAAAIAEERASDAMSDDGTAADPPSASREVVELPDLELPEIVDVDALRRSAADARARVDEARAGYQRTRNDLARVEADLAAQSQAASAAQARAAEAQREQAELALAGAQSRVEDLEVTAPAAGVVELARDLDGEAAADPGVLAGLGDAGETGDVPGLAGLGGLLGGAASGTASSSGPLAVGMDVRAGQQLLTIFDLSGFTAGVDVDEIDVVDLEVGQPVTVLVDAFPDAELPGTVRHIALSPRQLAAGGAVFPVVVDLEPPPPDVRLRVGLTASAEIQVERRESETVVPTTALLRLGGQEVVYLVRDGVAVETPVEVEVIGDESAAISGDVDVGDEVVTQGVDLLEDGRRVVVGE